MIAAGHPIFATIAFLGSFVGIYFYLKIIVSLFMTEDVTKYGESNRKYGVMPILAIVMVLMMTIPTLIHPDLFNFVLSTGP